MQHGDRPAPRPEWRSSAIGRRSIGRHADSGPTRWDSTGQPGHPAGPVPAVAPAGAGEPGWRTSRTPARPSAGGRPDVWRHPGGQHVGHHHGHDDQGGDGQPVAGQQQHGEQCRRQGQPEHDRRHGTDAHGHRGHQHQAGQVGGGDPDGASDEHGGEDRAAPERWTAERRTRSTCRPPAATRARRPSSSTAWSTSPGSAPAPRRGRSGQLCAGDLGEGDGRRPPRPGRPPASTAIAASGPGLGGQPDRAGSPYPAPWPPRPMAMAHRNSAPGRMAEGRQPGDGQGEGAETRSASRAR